ncbi:hypothetical protein [Ancylobacter sp.]|uniref:hypothetical protein n=1 Tax=Ancylobacter sp. TaxID=1872567 RepID=UPI003C79D6C9
MSDKETKLTPQPKPQPKPIGDGNRGVQGNTKGFGPRPATTSSGSGGGGKKG